MTHEYKIGDIVIIVDKDAAHFGNIGVIDTYNTWEGIFYYGIIFCKINGMKRNNLRLYHLGSRYNQLTYFFHDDDVEGNRMFHKLA